VSIYLSITYGKFLAVVVAFITGVIGPIAVLYIKNKLNKRRKNQTWL
jgi:capsular polysaccharide biosynthesis protein